MKRRNFIVTTALLAAVAIAPIACKKDEAGGGGGAGAASGEAATMLSMLPKDSKLVMGISLSAARTSSLFKKFEGELNKNLPSDIAKIKKECGLDLTKDISTVVISGDPADEEAMVLAAKGNFDQAKVEACVVKMGGTVEGGVYTVDGEISNTVWAAKDIVVMSPSFSVDKLKGFASGNSVKDNAALMGLIGKVDTSATVWVVGDVPSDAGGMLGSIGAKAPKSGFLSLSVGSGVKAKVGMVFESSADADTTKGAINGILTMAKGQPGAEFLKSVDTKVNGETLTIKVKISGKQIDALKGMGLPF